MNKKETRVLKYGFNRIMTDKDFTIEAKYTKIMNFLNEFIFEASYGNFREKELIDLIDKSLVV